MDRRKFLSVSGSSTLGLSFFSGTLFASQNAGNMKAKELNAYLRSLVEVTEPSVDKIIVGDPETVISKIGTAWMPYWKTLRKARDRGVNTLVVHEPTFYTHLDLDEKKWSYHNAPSPGKEMYLNQVAEKKKWIEDNGMVVIRCHDVLDKIEGYGIPFAFGRGLGFQDSDIVRSKMYYNVYNIEPKPAIEVARWIASKLKGVGQPGVAFYGDENYLVKTVGLGTGCICDPLNHRDMDMDLAISIDDSIQTWRETTFSEDTGKPLVVVNHGTTEEFGMKELSDQLNKSFTKYEIIHFSQGCGYRWITS